MRFLLGFLLILATSQDDPEDPPPTLDLLEGFDETFAGLPIPGDPGHPAVQPTSGGTSPQSQSRLRFSPYRSVYRNHSSSVVLVAGPRLLEKGESRLGHGTGFVISSDGFVVTNRHVVEEMTQIMVLYKKPGRKLPKIDKEYRKEWARRAVIVRMGRDVDLALLKVIDPPEGVVPLRIAEEEAIEQAMDVLAIGHPADYRFSKKEFPASLWDVAPGMVRNLQEKDGYSLLIRHTAPIDRGNSGGPLFSMEGTVVGVNTMKPPEHLNMQGVFWSIGAPDIRVFLKPHESIMSENLGGPDKPEKGAPSFHLGFFPEGSVTVRFKPSQARRNSSLQLGIGTVLRKFQFDGRQWMLRKPKGRGWIPAGKIEFDPKGWNTITFERSEILTLKVNGKSLESIEGISTRPWVWVETHLLKAELEKGK